MKNESEKEKMKKLKEEPQKEEKEIRQPKGYNLNNGLEHSQRNNGYGRK